MPNSVLEASIDPGIFLIDAEILIEYPWLVVGRVRYGNGTRYDITWCEDTEPEDFDLFYEEICPMFAVRLDIRETSTLPYVAVERTCSYWVME